MDNAGLPGPNPTLNARSHPVGRAYESSGPGIPSLVGRLPQGGLLSPFDRLP